MIDEQRLSSPLLATKFQPPPLRAGLVSRPRLLQKLSPQYGVRITLVSAPAGSGKSTLLTQWRASANRTVAWLSLQPRDNALHRFLRYFIAALRQIEKRIAPDGGEVPPSLKTPAVESLLTALINDVAATAEPFTLILDDYHVITAVRIHEALLFLIHNLPPSLHLVIATRADPPWPLSRLRARRELVEIRGDDLRFTTAEAAAVLNDGAGLELGPELVTALERQTEGWIAGLQLAGLALHAAGDEQRQRRAQQMIENFASGHHFVIDYLTEEVVEQQPVAMRTFLLQTSLLERLCGPLCDALTASSDGTERLCRLERSNAFIVPLDTEGHWYRYHHLFGGMLRRRLEETPGANIPNLYLRASEWCEQENLIEEAIVYALGADDVERAAQLVETYGMRFIASGDTATVAEWLEALPETTIGEHLQLCVFRAAAAHWTGERARVRFYLEQAEKLLTASRKEGLDEPARILGYIDSVRANAALTAGSIESAREGAERAVARLRCGDIIHAQAAIARGGAYCALGERTASERAFREAYTSALAGGHRRYAVIPATYVALQQIKQGCLYEAADTCHSAWESGSAASGGPLPVVGFPAIRLGDLQREWNQLDKAEATLQQALALCLRLNQVDIVADAHLALARLQLAQGQWERATQSVAEAEQLVAQTNVDGFVTSWLQGARLRLWLATGHLAAAVQWAEANELQPDGELSY